MVLKVNSSKVQYLEGSIEVDYNYNTSIVRNIDGNVTVRNIGRLYYLKAFRSVNA